VSQHRCPYCNSENLDWDLLDEECGIADDQTYKNYSVTCLDCHREWYQDETHDLISWERTDIDGNVIDNCIYYTKSTEKAKIRRH